MKLEEALERLTYVCNVIPTMLHALPEEEFRYQASAVQWSKIEILGHLIDSATYNHARIVRAQFEENPFIRYAQNECVTFNFYQTSKVNDLIALWLHYNRHLLHLIAQIPSENRQRMVTVDTDLSIPLSEVVISYVNHTEHHLRQIVTF